MTAKRGWHNPAKFVKHAVHGACPYCRKHVKSLETHISAKHKGKPLP